ncbi:hypothetical protein [Paraburkholderia humisilvae]|uniref:Uncharacterized protein n=1 Tax=Paraburkholderia humisilvae TaxID=627669 RepID=A0A6J5DRG2_9BURK|nr:hypothetical protein LMG29542_02763 [Paraburkholderia humisilvae]
MRQTVFGLFNTYAEADGARNALVESGFAFHEVELRANPETASDAIADESPGVLANIERFFASLFSTSGPAANESIVEHYTDAVRRGAVLVSVDAATDVHTELARNTLMRLGARDVSEQPYLSPPQRDDTRQVEQARREHSMLDELGIGGPAARPTAAPPPREPLSAIDTERRFERVDAPPHDTPTDDVAARTAIAAGGAPGSGAVLRPDLAKTGRRELDDAAMREAAQSPDAQPAPPRDEFSKASGGGFGKGSGGIAGTMPPSAGGSQQTQSMLSARAEDSGYPAKTAYGTAHYQSDPSDISRATSLPGQGLWQREAIQRGGPQGAGEYPTQESRSTTNIGVRDEHQPPQMTSDADVPPDTAQATGQRISPNAVRSTGTRVEGVGGDAGTLRPAAAGAPGMTNEYEARQSPRDGGGLGAPIPDEFLEYEEDFRTHYDEQYGAREGARYDEYVPAYRYGAKMGGDARYQDRPWDEDVELDARQDWERTAPEGSWDRFKAAVRHGWERVTGHHHHPH